MKTSFSSILVLTALATSALATEKTPITFLNSVNYSGNDLSTKTLELGYRIGGGCQKHSTEVAVELAEKPNSLIQVLVKVYDVTPEPDYCEAMLSMNEKVDITALVTAACKKSKIENCKEQTKELILPSLLL